MLVALYVHDETNVSHPAHNCKRNDTYTLSMAAIVQYNTKYVGYFCKEAVATQVRYFARVEYKIF